ncbi:MAG TPA: hypothetical protein VK675_03565 [Candidatus Paceibacterota bacterium]|nr:hypothetical protein [Candidatus Paceibacterota bacterium]
MDNEIMKLLLKNSEERGLVGEMQLDLYELQLLAYPLNMQRWSYFRKLRELFS